MDDCGGGGVDGNVLLTAESEADFFALEKPVKAVLFSARPDARSVARVRHAACSRLQRQCLTAAPVSDVPAPRVPRARAAKKTETPKLWLRLAEEWGSSCTFGEVRLEQAALMHKHGVKEEDLPRVVAFVAGNDADADGADGADGAGGHRPFHYEGPTDFDRISTFLGDLAKGGMSVLEIRRLADERDKDIERLKAELEREREALAVAKAEIARSKLGQVGVGEGLKKDLHDAREREKALEAAADQLRAERGALQAEVKAMQEVLSTRVVKLGADNIDAFLSNATRPLKAVLFTTKTETPPLWLQLADAQSTTSAFGVVHHVETALMQKFKLEVSDLPRICIYLSGKEPVVYDGEVKLDALSSFLRDTVEGGDAVIAMRQQVRRACTRALSRWWHTACERVLSPAVASVCVEREGGREGGREVFLCGPTCWRFSRLRVRAVLRMLPVPARCTTPCGRSNASQTSMPLRKGSVSLCTPWRARPPSLVRPLPLFCRHIRRRWQGGTGVPPARRTVSAVEGADRACERACDVMRGARLGADAAAVLREGGREVERLKASADKEAATGTCDQCVLMRKQCIEAAAAAEALALQLRAHC